MKWILKQDLDAGISLTIKAGTVATEHCTKDNKKFYSFGTYPGMQYACDEEFMIANVNVFEQVNDIPDFVDPLNVLGMRSVKEPLNEEQIIDREVRKQLPSGVIDQAKYDEVYHEVKAKRIISKEFNNLLNHGEAWPQHVIDRRAKHAAEYPITPRETLAKTIPDTKELMDPVHYHAVWDKVKSGEYKPVNLESVGNVKVDDWWNTAIAVAYTLYELANDVQVRIWAKYNIPGENKYNTYKGQFFLDDTRVQTILERGIVTDVFMWSPVLDGMWDSAITEPLQK